MAISTGLSVPIFNVLKYFFIILFIETIARGALNNIHIFFRKFDLYRGRSTSLAKSRIDRYNLLQVRGKGTVVRIFSWALLVTCFYAVEIMFEFSSDATSQLTAHSERFLVYNASYSSCDPSDLFQSFLAVRLTEMAISCVDVTEIEYVLYRPVWFRDVSSGENNAAEAALCVKIPQNVLQRGERIYKDRRFGEGSPSWDAVSDLIEALKVNAWSADGDKDRALVVLPVLSADIYYTVTYTLPENNLYQRASLLVVQVPSRPGAMCGGFVVGTVGDDLSRVAMTACIANSTSGYHYLEIHGTATVPLDPDRVEKEIWNVDVSIYFGIAIRNFTDRVFDPNDKGAFAKVIAYGGMLSIAAEKDDKSLNKYAALYKHCNLFKVPEPMDAIQWRKVEFAKAEEVITVSLSEWGLIMVVAWSLSLWVVAYCLLGIADRKGMPKAVEGELDIARRWAARENSTLIPDSTGLREESPLKRWIYRFRGSQVRQAFLNVEVGSDCDDIVASRIPERILRDCSKPFKDL